MSDVKLSVSADVGNLKSGLAEIGRSVDGVSKAMQGMKVPTPDTTGMAQSAAKLRDTLGKATQGGMKWTPFDMKAIERDMAKMRQQLLDLQKLSPGKTPLGISPAVSGAGLPQVAPGQSAGSNVVPLFPPVNASRRTGRHSRTYAPDVTDIGRNLVSGFGGGVGTVSSYATRGAIAGAQEGGAVGGGLGLLRGGLIGAGVLGALKIGQGVSEGYDMAKDRNTSLDELKRQMGDLGVSFNRLKEMSTLASDGLNINQKEAAKLAVEFNQLSHGAEKTPEGLTGAVRSGVGLSQAYGLQPSAGVNFLAGMRQIDPRQNNRELAVMLAETIGKAGMASNAESVMQALQSLSASTARLSLSAPNVTGFAGAYGSLMGSGTSGMTHEGAVGILSQANSAVASFGGMGDAGRNFLYGAINAKGAMNPIDAMALAEGGMFGSRNSVFGDEHSAIHQFYKSQGLHPEKLAGGPNGDVTTFESIRDHIKEQYKGQDKRLMLDGFKGVMKLSSLGNASQLFNMPIEQISGLGKIVKRSGLDINSINTSGLQTMTKIGAAGTPDELKRIYADMEKRTGPGSLNGDDKAAWDKAKGGSFDVMQDALVKIAASKDMQQTEASQTLAGMKAIEKAQTDVGDKLIVPMNTMRDVMVMAFGGGKGTKSIHEAFLKGERDDINSTYDKQSDEVKAKYAKYKDDLLHGSSASAADKTKVFNEYTAREKAALATINASRSSELSAVDANGKPIPAPAAAADKPGQVAPASAAVSKDAQIMQESGGVNLNPDGSLIRSKKGALGIAQVLPSTGASPGFGIKPLRSYSVEDQLAFRNDYMDVATKRYGGDRQKALESYNAGIPRTDKAIARYGDNWSSHMPKESQDYASRIMNAENGFTPMPGAGGKTKQAANDTLHITIEAPVPIHAPDGKVVGTKMLSASVNKSRGSGSSRVVLA